MLLRLTEPVSIVGFRQDLVLLHDVLIAAHSRNVSTAYIVRISVVINAHH